MNFAKLSVTRKTTIKNGYFNCPKCGKKDLTNGFKKTQKDDIQNQEKQIFSEKEIYCNDCQEANKIAMALNHVARYDESDEKECPKEFGYQEIIMFQRNVGMKKEVKQQKNGAKMSIGNEIIVLINQNLLLNLSSIIKIQFKVIHLKLKNQKQNDNDLQKN